MSAHDETFLAIKRTGEQDKIELEAAINYDIYGDIDHRNGWQDDDSPNENDHDVAVKLGAEGFREWLKFCYEGVSLEPDGVGMQTAIRRFVAVAQFMCPDLIRREIQIKVKGSSKFASGPPVTLKELAEQPDVDCDPKLLRKMSEEFLDRWLGKKVARPTP